MADFSNQTVTLAGRKMLAQAIADQKTIQFTRIECGDGEAPEAPENLTALVHRLFSIGVGQVYKHPDEPGTWCVSGSFVATSDKGDFYHREAGIFAKIADEEDAQEILFAYLNAGETADFIRSVSAKSMTQIDLNFSIVLGQAAVEYVYDPNALATLKAIQDAQESVDKAIKDFTEDTIADLKQQQQELITKMDAAGEELKKAEAGFLLKGGDTTTGDITMGQGFHLVGDVTGSASQWCGWRHFESIAEIDAVTGEYSEDPEKLDPATVTMKQLLSSLPNNSVLVHVLSERSNNPEFPDTLGLLEVKKSSASFAQALFTSFTGQAFVGALYNDEFTGWRTTTGTAPGQGSIFFGPGAAPIGWLFAQGQSVKKATYFALYNALLDPLTGKCVYGEDDDNFNLPDSRGMFLRGFDDGRGIDSGRKFGTDQQSGVPDIEFTLTLLGEIVTGPAIKSKSTRWVEYAGHGNYYHYENVFNVAASSASPVYQSGITEARPTNVSVRYIIKY